MASVHVCLTHSNSPSFTPSSSSCRCCFFYFSSTRASSACHSLPRFCSSLRPCCSDPPRAFPSLSSCQPESLPFFSLCSASVIHTLALHVLLLFSPPLLPLVPAPLFKTFPPFQSQSLLSIKASILPYSNLTLCLDGVRKLMLLPSPKVPGERQETGKEEDAAFYPRTGCLRVQNTNATPTALQLFFDDLFIAWQPVSSKKAVVGRPAGRQLGS